MTAYRYYLMAALLAMLVAAPALAAPTGAHAGNAPSSPCLDLNQPPDLVDIPVLDFLRANPLFQRLDAMTRWLLARIPGGFARPMADRRGGQVHMVIAVTDPGENTLGLDGGSGQGGYDFGPFNTGADPRR